MIALQRGFQVRGVVRSENSASDLGTKNKLIAEAMNYKQLELTVVPDFLKPGAIQEALDGVTTVIHLASPLAIEVYFQFCRASQFIHA